MLRMPTTLVSRARLAVIAAVLVASAASASTPVAINIPVYLKDPVGIVINPNNGRIYLLDIRPTYQFNSAGYVHVINGDTNQFVKTIAVGQFSKGITFDGYHNKVYVTNNLDSNVSIIDANTDQLVLDGQGNPKTIPIHNSPAAIAFSYYTSYTYVTYEDNVRNIPAVAVIDGATDTVIGNITGFDRDLTAMAWPVRGDTAHLMYALGGGSPARLYSIQPFGGGGSIIRTTDLGNSQSNPFPSLYRAIASENTRSLTFIANSYSNTVSAVDREGTVIHTIPVPARPTAIAGEDHWATGGGHVFVACEDAGSVVEISGHSVTRTWTGFTLPTAVLFNPRNHQLYVACGGTQRQLFAIHI